MNKVIGVQTCAKCFFKPSNKYNLRSKLIFLVLSICFPNFYFSNHHQLYGHVWFPCRIRREYYYPWDRRGDNVSLGLRRIMEDNVTISSHVWEGSDWGWHYFTSLVIVHKVFSYPTLSQPLCN